MKLQIQNLLPLLESTKRIKKPSNVVYHQEGGIVTQYQNQGTRKLLYQLKNRMFAGK
ncbi:MAG: hypothetical protein JXB49_03725 [Bacteroidales bacterium]|nr:hypothetical protein [Bacteroidales bacterium]